MPDSTEPQKDDLRKRLAVVLAVNVTEQPVADFSELEADGVEDEWLNLADAVLRFLKMDGPRCEKCDQTLEYYQHADIEDVKIFHMKYHHRFVGAV